MKCTCGAGVADGLIRCGNCGKPTAAILKHKTEYEYLGEDGKRRPINLNTRATTSLKRNDRKVPAGCVHAYNLDSGEGV